MRPQVRAYVYDNGDRVFGPGPRDLLRGVDRTGSLSAAAAGMGMAYTKATRLVCDAERAFGIRLLERKVGGSHGGGSRLTDAARELLDAYGRYEADVRAAAQASFDANLAVLTSDAAPTTPTSCAVSTRHATPFAMPCEPGSVGCVVMAAGAFVHGSSIELSADGPIRPPYAVYFQGGLTWYHAKLGILMSLQKLVEQDLAALPEKL